MGDPATAGRLAFAERIRDMLSLEGQAQQMLYQETWYTWDAIRAAAVQAREAVADLKPGAPVGVIARNHPLILGAVLGLLADSRCVLPFPVLGKDSYLAGEIGQLNPPVLIALDQDWAREPITRVAREVGIGRIEIAPAPAGGAGFSVSPASAAPASPAVYPDGTAFVLQTSGTTGAPKRVPVSYRNIEAALDAMRARAKSDRSSDTDSPRLRSSLAILNTPVSHTSGMLAFCLNMVEGRRLALLDKFEPQRWAELVRDYWVASAGVPPAALSMLMEAEIPPGWLASLKMIRSGTAPLDPDLASRFEDRFGIPVVQAYGATEFQGITAWSLGDHQKYGRTKRGSVGRSLPGVRLRVTDPDSGEELPAGSTGRLEVRSAAASVTTDSGWVSTNDRARIDEDGFLWILGRLDDVINRGGLKVDSAAVARALQGHDWVRSVAVVGVTDQRLGELPCAAVVLSDAAPDAVSTEGGRSSSVRLPASADGAIHDPGEVRHGRRPATQRLDEDRPARGLGAVR
jgi:long-chain acyl-CoA synthetase